MFTQFNQYDLICGLSDAHPNSIQIGLLTKIDRKFIWFVAKLLSTIINKYTCAKGNYSSYLDLILNLSLSTADWKSCAQTNKQTNKQRNEKTKLIIYYRIVLVQAFCN